MKISLLREENARLKQIISLLAQQVGQGSDAYYDNTQKDIQPDQLPQSYLQEGNQSKHLFQSDVQEEIGMKQVPYSNLSENIGTIQPSHSNLQKGIDLNQVPHSNVHEDIGTTQQFHSNPQETIDVKQIIQPADQLNIESGQQVHSHPSQNIMTNATVEADPFATRQDFEPNENDVAVALRAFMSNSRRSGRHVAAKILIHLVKKEKNTNMELRKLTGMSATGVAKQLMALKKRGMILPVRFQQYTLGPVGLKIIDDCVAKMQKTV